MPDIVPVDHDPFDGADPFEMAAARTREGVMPASGRQQQGLLSSIGPAAVQGLASLPERAMHAAGDLQRTGDVYDPAPAVDAALLTMGGTSFGASKAKLVPVDHQPEFATEAAPNIRLYHGSPNDFDKFDVSKTNQGVWLTEDQDLARSYVSGKGKLYQVDVKAPKENFIDRNKQFDEQSEPVRSAVREMASSLGIPIRGNESGGWVYNKISRALAGPDGIHRTGIAKANELLSARNVPGIKDDAGGFIVFNDKLLNIVK